MSSILRKMHLIIVSWLNSLLDILLRRKYLFLAVVVFNTITVYLTITHLPFPFNIAIGAVIIISSTLFIVYHNVMKRIGIIPVSDDLVFILIHMKSMMTSNPPLTTLFQKVGETTLYKKKYRELYAKVANLTKNWGYSLPESLKLVSKEAPNRVDEQLFQRFSAIVATGANVKEYLRLEYSTLFSEYKSGYTRMIEALRVVLGVYTTLVGALTFLVATLILLGVIFGGVIELTATVLISVGISLLAMSVLLYVSIRRPLFEYSKSKAPLAKYIKFLGLTGNIVFTLLILRLIITHNIFDLNATSMHLIYAGAALLPASILIKVYEGRINEYDTFFPAFLRSFGEHLAVVPNQVESLKPLLTAELGKLKKLLTKVYASLLNKIDPRTTWTRFYEESGSEFIARGMKIFTDTFELGGDTGEAGALLSDHVNELYRLRLMYMQVFRVFEITLYVMHLTAVALIIFIGGFMDLFMKVIAYYAITIPPEIVGITGFFTATREDVVLMVNITSIILSISNTMALCSVNPGSKYAVHHYLSIILIITGIGIFIGSAAMNILTEALLTPLA